MFCPLGFSKYLPKHVRKCQNTGRNAAQRRRPKSTPKEMLAPEIRLAKDFTPQMLKAQTKNAAQSASMGSSGYELVLSSCVKSWAQPAQVLSSARPLTYNTWGSKQSRGFKDMFNFNPICLTRYCETSTYIRAVDPKSGRLACLRSLWPVFLGADSCADEATDAEERWVGQQAALQI